MSVPIARATEDTQFAGWEGWVVHMMSSSVKRPAILTTLKIAHAGDYITACEATAMKT